MLSRKTIEAYLFFLLRHRIAVSVVVAAITFVLAGFMYFRMHVFTNFFDLYPPNHPYIKLYTQYRSMFGTANTLLLVVEVKDGTIFDDPATVQKVDRITLALLHDIPGVNGEQVLSITHPKIKTTLTAGSGIKVVPLMYPRVPENKEDLEFLKLKVYTTEGVKGPFVSEDDKATLIIAGFWEEYFDLPTMWAKIQEIVRQESDANTKIYVSGPPILYAYFLDIMPKMVNVLAASIVMILLILWIEFRSWQGVVIPAFSGTLSAIWGLGFGGLCAAASQYVSNPQLKMLMNVSLDPLVLVIPLLISARAHSHSVQSMERYHEEYHRLRDKNLAIVKSYAEIYAPAMVSILADGVAILTLLVARIPIIQKLAILCSFWIISIFISVVTLHPIILSFTPPPAEEHVSGRTPLERFMAWMMVVALAWLFWLYDYIPGAPVAALLLIALLGLDCDLLVRRVTTVAQHVAGWLAVVVGGTVALAAADRFGTRGYDVAFFALASIGVLGLTGDVRGMRMGAWVGLLLVAPAVAVAQVTGLLAGGVGAVARIGAIAAAHVAILAVASALVLAVYSPIGFGISRATDAFGAFFGRVYVAIERSLIWLATGSRRPAMAVALVSLLSFGLYFQHLLKVGDTTPGAALLYPKHPYNVAFGKVNEKFLGASQLVIIAEGNSYCTVGGKPCEGDGCKLCLPEDENACGAEKCEQREGAIKDANTLNDLDLFARYMAERSEVGGTVTATTLLKKIFRTFHEADPKWEILPTRDDHVSQLFFLLTSGTRRGEMDRFFDMNYTNATIAVFYKDYTHETIERSIARAKEYITTHGAQTEHVRYRLAGGLIGILAAVNEEVEWSYRVNLVLILIVVFLLSYATYVSVIGALIVMLPSLVAQPLSEAVMYLFGIDMNINSLPVAAVGIGIGIDYGYYVLSRIVEELSSGVTFDLAIRRMFETTGKTVLFTGVSLTASIIFWVFFPMKFQADMALLLVLLLAFHLMGALMFIPPMVALFKPRFAIKYAEERQRIRAEEAAAAEADAARVGAAGR
jgi:predicted RND superfamily exporter protein